MRSIILLLILLICTSLAHGQTNGKLDKLEERHFKSVSFEGDSSYRAIVLADIGTSTIRYDQNSGWYLLHERQLRILVLSEAGLDLGNFDVSLYSEGSYSQQLSSFKGSVNNLDGSKISETKVRRNDGVLEKEDENWSKIKYALPNVRVGSIIELEYEVRSDYMSILYPWRFQREIPTLWSEYQVVIPEFFEYKRLMQGSQSMKVNEVSNKNEVITLAGNTGGSRGTRLGQSGNVRNSTVNYRSTIYHWAAENIPAFKVEPYMTSLENYISKIDFELSMIKNPNTGEVVSSQGSWSDINKGFLESSNLGGKLEESGFLSGSVNNILTGAESNEEKLVKIFEWVRQNVKWNGRNSKYASSGFKNILEAKEGNSADVNLLLGNLLTKAGFSVHPVVVSTRNNGFVKREYPISRQFNYIIIEVELGEGKMFLDATDKQLPLNLLPHRAMNYLGFRVAKEGYQWVEIKSIDNQGVNHIAELELTEDGEIKGEIFSKFLGYEASNMRSMINEKGDEFKAHQETKHDWSILEHQIDNLENSYGALQMTYNLETNRNVEKIGDLIYFNPLFVDHLKENPFKSDTRDFPVDFIFKTSFNYTLSIRLPKGYVVEELPSETAIGLPERAGVFRVFVQQAEDRVDLRYQLNISKTLFTSVDYPYLREFFNQIVAKEEEFVVIKKSQ